MVVGIFLELFELVVLSCLDHRQDALICLICMILVLIRTYLVVRDIVGIFARFIHPRTPLMLGQL